MDPTTPPAPPLARWPGATARWLALGLLVSGCYGEPRVTVPDAAPACRLTRDCAPGLACVSGVCAVECREDRDCIGVPAGPVCAAAEGRCVAMDAGATPDAPEVDAALAELSLDAPADVASDASADAPVEADATADAAPAWDADATVALDAPPEDVADATPEDVAAGEVAAPGDVAPDAPACSSPAPAVTEGLWGRYVFDGDAMDHGGARRHGAVVGPAGFGPSPRCQAVEFSAGSGAYVDLPDRHFQRVTAAAWARWSPATTTGGSIFDGWTRSENVLLHAVIVAGAPQWEARFHDRPDTARQHNEIFVRAPARLGAWQHVAATYDGATLRLYVDGVARGYADTDRSYAYPAPSGDPDLRVGAGREGNTWGGAIDELLVYERALSGPEVGLLAGCPGGVCGDACAAGQHRCDGACVSDTAVATCGTRCAPCPAVPSGTARCDGTACRYDVVLQPGPAGSKDIWTTDVYSYAPGGSGPGGGRDDELLKVGGWGDTYLSLLEFDLRGLPASPESATLELYCFSHNGATGTAVWVDRITAPWDWRAGGTGRDRERLWWADRPPATPWRMVEAPAAGAWQRIDLLPLVTEWVSGRTPNHGVSLRPVGTNNNFNFYHSADATLDPTLRPRLVVRY